MIIVTPQPVHGIVAGAPQIIGIIASDPSPIQRTFTGKGSPNSQLLAGNGKYNGIGSGWIVGASLANGGANYSPGDLLTENAGGVGTAQQITVDLVDANGSIIDWHYMLVGNYNTYPASTAAFSGGAGAGAIFNLSIPLPDYYIDNTTASSPVLYVCTSAGSNASSTWAKISGGGGGGLVLYDPTQAYTGGQIVYKATGTNPGLWAVQPGQTVAAGTNNIATITFPIPANSPWLSLAFGIQSIGACGSIGETDIFINASGPF